jgi:hypothetical protein
LEGFSVFILSSQTSLPNRNQTSDNPNYNQKYSEDVSGKK